MILILSIFIFCQIVFALPRFAVKNGTSCTLCHVNPTGGSLRNEHGTTVFSMEDLPMEKMQKYTFEDWGGFAGDYLQIGGDFRVQGFSYTEDDTKKTAIFPMQADIYADVAINEKANIFYKLSLGPQPKQEFWALFSIIPNNGWIKIGSSLPNYGLKLDDHTLFIRGGNLNRTHGLSKEGMPFSPRKQNPGIIELGYNISDAIGFTASIANSFANSNNSIYESEELKDKNITAKLSYVNTFFKKMNVHISPSFMKESDLQLMGISGGISLGKFIWTGEVDQAKNWPDEETAIALYSEIVFEIKQGIHFTGKYDYFDPDSDNLTGSISRYTFGLELYPLNILEIKMQGRFTQLDLEGSAEPDPEYLIQFHTWF